MAQNLQILKRRIKTAGNITQIAKAMEMIAASKIKRAQAAVLHNKPYKDAIVSHTQNILQNSQNTKILNPYTIINQSKKRLLIAIAPDKGLCGALVTNLAKKLLESDSPDTSIIVIGKKLERIALKLTSPTVATFSMGTALPTYTKVYTLFELIREYYIEKKVSKVEILYPEFTSFFTQTPSLIQLLPVDITKPVEALTTPYIFEPSAENLLAALMPHYIEILLYNVLIEAHTAEQAARMMAMQNAKNNARDIADYLKLTYNKSRQERITNELLDLTNGQIAI